MVLMGEMVYISIEQRENVEKRTKYAIVRTLNDNGSISEIIARDEKILAIAATIKPLTKIKAHVNVTTGKYTKVELVGLVVA